MLNRSLTIFVSKLVGYGIRLILPFFLVRLMTMTDFGAYRQFFLLEVYIATLFQLGINQALYYFVPRDERNAGAFFVNSLGLNIVIFTAAFTAISLVRQPLSAWLNMAILDSAFWYLAVFTMILMLITSCDCYLTARQRVKASALFEVSGQLFVSLTTVAAALHWRDLERIIQAMTAARAVQLLCMLAYIQFRLRGFRAERYLVGVWPQVRYGVVLGLGGILFSIQSRMDQLFVSRHYGTESFAIYSVGCTEIPVMRLFAQSVAVVALGQFAFLEQQGDWEGIRRLWNRILTSMYALAIPTIGLLLLLSEPLVRIMFTESYIEAVPIFRINVLLKLNLIWNATLVLRAMNRNDVTVWVNLTILLVTPLALYGGMLAAGMTGLIGAQFLLILSGRLLHVAWLNHVSSAGLGYIVAPRAVLSLYRETWRKLISMASARRRSMTGRGDQVD